MRRMLVIRMLSTVAFAVPSKAAAPEEGLVEPDDVDRWCDRIVGEAFGPGVEVEGIARGIIAPWERPSTGRQLR